MNPPGELFPPIVRNGRAGGRSGTGELTSFYRLPSRDWEANAGGLDPGMLRQKLTPYLLWGTDWPTLTAGDQGNVGLCFQQVVQFLTISISFSGRYWIK